MSYHRVGDLARQVDEMNNDLEQRDVDLRDAREYIKDLQEQLSDLHQTTQYQDEQITELTEAKTCLVCKTELALSHD